MGETGEYLRPGSGVRVETRLDGNGRRWTWGNLNEYYHDELDAGTIDFQRLHSLFLAWEPVPVGGRRRARGPGRATSATGAADHRTQKRPAATKRPAAWSPPAAHGDAAPPAASDSDSNSADLLAPPPAQQDTPVSQWRSGVRLTHLPENQEEG